MNQQRYVVGIDIGTTSTKTVLFTQQGTVVQEHSIGYPLLSPTPDVAEQDPDEILAAVTTTVRQVIQESQINPASILCLSFSAAMHSLIAVDAEGKPLTRSLTWADNRSVAWAERIKQQQGRKIYQRTGVPVHPMSPFIKLVWLRHEQSELFQKAAKFVSIKEYVFYQLFGEYVVDYSIASASGLLNLTELTWDREALTIAGITQNHLSELVPTTYVVQPLPTGARRLGVEAKTPVVIGASDGVLSSVGVGAIAPGVVAVTVGTSGAVRAVVDRPLTDTQERLFCYAFTKNYWTVGGAVNNGGVALRWVRNQLTDTEVRAAERLGKNPYELITMLAETVPAGSEGLIFHPYLLGERSPIWNADARGSYFGLNINHSKAHLVRAVLEGIVYNLFLVLEALEDAIGAATRIQATGGFARSSLWRQMMADVFNRQVIVPKSFQSSALGAAVLGLYALNNLSSLEVSSMIGETYQQKPIPRNVAMYQKILPLYKSLLNKFQTEYESIAQLQVELAEER
ncbi:MAG: gluconokinase [Cyanophyceae cyanobacterium]